MTAAKRGVGPRAGVPDAAYAGSVIDALREPLLVLSDTLIVVRANAAFQEAFEVGQERLEGRSLYHVTGRAWDTPPVRQLLDRVLTGTGDPQDLELEQGAPPCPPRILRVSARRVAQGGGRFPLVLFAVADITEPRRIEEVMRAAMAELERSNSELESFASIAAHDLQEPVRKIRAFGERLEATCDGKLPEAARDSLARMMTAAARMEKLIIDLLTLARVTGARRPWEPVSLAAMARDVAADVEEELSRAGGHVEVGTLPTVQGDPTQLRQLFQNLVGNAVKFRGDRPPHISITSVEVDAGPSAPPGEPAVWQIVVSDNGIGFDPQYAERIFRPFERLHGRRAYEGTGIGLALCERIVRRHGGTIRAESAPDRGSRFILQLPGSQAGPV